MNIAHPIASEEIMSLLYGELSVDRARFVSEHLKECGECRKVREQLGHVSKALSSWTVPNAPTDPGFEGRLLTEALSLAPKGPSFWNTKMLRLSLKLATCVAAVVMGVGAWVTLTLRNSALAPDREPMTVAMHAERQLSLGERYAAVDMERPIEGNATAPKAGPTTGGNIGGVIGGLGAAPSDSYRRWLKDGATSPKSGKERETGSIAPQRYTARELAEAPMIARTAWISVVVKDFAAARGLLDAILLRQRGYAASLTASTEPNSRRSLQASLRIPAAELPAALAELKSLGRVENETQGGEEVTQQHADLVARLKNSRETEQRLQAILLQRTGKISDVLAVEQEIARVRGEIERMEAEQKSLEHRVEFATVDLLLAEEYQAQLTAPSPSLSIRLRNAVVRGYRSGFETAVGIVLFILEVGPSLLLWLIIFSPVGWFLRRRWLRAQTLVS